MLWALARADPLEVGEIANRLARLNRHIGAARPALLKTAFYRLAAGAEPKTLRRMLQALQQGLGPWFFMVVGQPDFGLVLVGR